MVRGIFLGGANVLRGQIEDRDMVAEDCVILFLYLAMPYSQGHRFPPIPHLLLPKYRRQQHQKNHQ